MISIPIRKSLTLATLLILVSACSFAQVYLSGKIKGYEKEIINLYKPIDDFINSHIPNRDVRITPEPSGIFSTTIPIATSTFIVLDISSNPIHLIVSPGDSISLTIQPNHPENNRYPHWLQITGSNAAGHLLFDSINYNPANKYLPLVDIFDNISLHKTHVAEVIADSIRSTLLPFDALYTSGKISFAYYQLAKSYFTSTLISDALKRFFRGSKIYKITTAAERDSIKEKLFYWALGDGSLIRNTLNAEFLFYYYYANKALRARGKELEIDLQDSVIYNKADTLKIRKEFVPLLYITDEKLREHIWGSMLYQFTESFRQYFGSDELAIYKAFFPNSPYTAYISRLHKQFAGAGVNALANREDIVFIDSVGALSSLRMLATRQFKNQVVYADIWASWCLPCRQDFALQAEPDSFFTKHNIARVYISIDAKEMKPEWLNVIASYQLRGAHVLAGQSLRLDIQGRLYRNQKSMTIPRYLIIGKNGRIVVPDAPRPSDPALKKILLKHL